MSALDRQAPTPVDPIDDAMRLMHELDAQKTDGPVRANAISRGIARLVDLAVIFPAAIAIIAAGDTIAVAAGVDLREDDFRPTQAGTVVSWITLIAVFVCGSAYEVAMTWLGGGTLGKRRLKLRVVGLDGGPVSLSRATVRFLVWAVPWSACFLGWGATFPDRPGWSLVFFLATFASLGLAAWAFRDPDGRGVHDRIAGTRVTMKQ
ncbi:MAG: RDD family protein [Dehalococcoidia bacterium]